MYVYFIYISVLFGLSQSTAALSHISLKPAIQPASQPAIANVHTANKQHETIQLTAFYETKREMNVDSNSI